MLLLKAGYGYVPFSSLESVVEEHKEAYYLALRRTQMSLEALTGEHRSTIKLRLSALLKQGRLARHGAGPATWYTLGPNS
jgi:Fic family protein